MLTIPNNIINIRPYISITNIYNDIFDIIKLDIQLCKSGEIVIYSDIFLGNDLISELTFSEIFIKDANILKLHDFLANKNYKLKILLEIKGTLIITDQLKNILGLIPNRELFDIIISSYNRSHLDKIGNSMIIKKGLITKNKFNVNNLISILNNLQYLIINWKNLDMETLYQCHSLGIKVFAYTLKKDKELKYILKYPVDGIITNKLLYKSLI